MSTMTSRSSLFSVRAALRTNSYARTPRKPNWSEIECEYLLQQIQTNLPVIRSRKPDVPGSRKSPKTDMWNRMCMGLHAKRPTVMRSVRELKDKWKKLQFMAKQHITGVRLNPTARRNAEGLVIIPKLVYRVLEVRGQDPKKAGFCCDAYTFEMRRMSSNTSLSLGDNSLLMEQDQTSVSPSLDLDTESAIKEEVTDVDQMYPDESPQEPDFTLQIQSAVSLAPAYNQTDRGRTHQPIRTSDTSTDVLPMVPVSLEKAVTCTASQANISSTAFSISSRLLQHKTPRTVASSSRNYRQPRAIRPAQGRPTCTSFNDQMQNQRQQTCNQDLQTSAPQRQFYLDVTEELTPMSNELTNSYTGVNELQASLQLEDNEQLLPHNSSVSSHSHDAPRTFCNAEEPSVLASGPNRPRLCQKSLLGHICDDEVVELQRDVLREEIDKIRLEKEILEMQREKLKLELMVLRQKVNGVR